MRKLLEKPISCWCNKEGKQRQKGCVLAASGCASECRCEDMPCLLIPIPHEPNVKKKNVAAVWPAPRQLTLPF